MRKLTHNEFVYDKEKELHRQYKHCKYTPLKSFDGYRECFEYKINSNNYPSFG